MGYKEPGFKKIPCPGKDELRPNQRNPKPYTLGEGREVLKYAQPNMMVGDFGSPDPNSSWASQAPSKATFTPGMPGEPRQTPKDKTSMTIQRGEMRQ